MKNLVIAHQNRRKIKCHNPIFNMHKKIITSLAAIMFLLSSFTNRQTPDGKTIYEKQCARCHGKQGTKGAFGAKNLQKSVMNDDAIGQLIISGKKAMPSFKTILNSNDIKLVTDYVKAFRK